VAGGKGLPAGVRGCCSWMLKPWCSAVLLYAAFGWPWLLAFRAASQPWLVAQRDLDEEKAA